MAKKTKSAISPTREENYPEWYQQIIKAADLAEISPVRGCMVIKPWGYGIWENMQRVLDGMFKATGHKNAYFPLFIPLSFLEKEAAHVDGFAKECAVVTHHRLEADGQGGLKPAGKLEQPLVVRPTSETIIGEMFAKWIQSYRDLPLLINQWANVVRWEMRTRIFLRTTEFLWQEGHTAHASADEAMDETRQMLDIYATFVEDYMAVPVIKGEKTPAERFPGAVNTYSIEAMMQDRKALQAGTSHYLGENFSKAANIKFLGADGNEHFAHTTSWGVSTRLVGAMIMAHSDDDGLVLPPRLAATQVVLLPIVHDEESRSMIMEYAENLARELRSQQFDDRPVAVEVDDRDMRGGNKVWEWIKKGVPLRVEIGKRDIEGGKVFVGRRDQGHRDKQSIPRDQFVAEIGKTLEDIQKTIFEKARKYRDENLVEIDNEKDFIDFFTAKNKKQPEIHGGFALACWNGDPEIEERIKKDLAVTIRCIPFNMGDKIGNCIFSGDAGARQVVFAKSY